MQRNLKQNTSHVRETPTHLKCLCLDIDLTRDVIDNIFINAVFLNLEVEHERIDRDTNPPGVILQNPRQES